MSKHQKQRAVTGGTVIPSPNPSKLIIPREHRDAIAVDRKDPHQSAMAALVQFAQSGRTVLSYCKLTRDFKAGDTIPIVCAMGKPNPETGMAGLLPIAILLSDDATTFLEPPEQIKSEERGTSVELACSQCERTGPKKPTPEELAAGLTPKHYTPGGEILCVGSENPPRKKEAPDTGSEAR